MSRLRTHQFNRRDFLKLTAAGGAALLGGCATIPATTRKLPIHRIPSDIVRIGMIGIGGKGSSEVSEVLKQKNARITALCDVDSTHVQSNKATLEKHGVKDVATFTDARKVLERDDVDAIIISTPNHWHALLAIWGCQAGKHVYVEKPVSYNLFESRQLQLVAGKYGCVVQAGTQNRSDVGLIPAFAKLRSGAFGKIKRITIVVYRNRTSIGRAPGPCVIPPTVDFDLWCGPAPKVPPHRLKLHYDWHYFWATGGGEISNQCPHELDLTRWVLGNPPPPRRILTMGGRFNFHDDGEAPNTALVIYDYPGVEVVLDMRSLPAAPGVDESPAWKNQRTGLVIDTDQGYFAGGRGGGKFFDRDGKPVEVFHGDGGEDHLPNFLQAILKADDSKLRAPVAQGADSACLSHFANLAYRTGHATNLGEMKNAVSGNSAASELLDRTLEHLKINGWDGKAEPMTLGGWLEWDQEKYQFTGGSNFDAANALITRDYRAPFVVPNLA